MNRDFYYKIYLLQNELKKRHNKIKYVDSTQLKIDYYLCYAIIKYYYDNKNTRIEKVYDTAYNYLKDIKYALLMKSIERDDFSEIIKEV